MKATQQQAPHGGMHAIFERIIVPIDGSQASHAAAQTAIGLAETFGGRVRFVFVLDVEHLSGELTFWSGKPVPLALDAVRASAAAALRDATASATSFEVPSETIALEGDIVEQIMLEAAAWKADSIVIGTHSRRMSFSPALGSKTAELLRHVTIPVLVVR